MRGRNLIKVAFKSIVKNKMRSLLTMLGIIIGVGAVIVMVAIGEGAQTQIERQIASLGTNLVMVTPGSNRQGGVSFGAGTSNRLTLEDVDKLRREAQLLTGVSPIIFTRSQIIANGNNWNTSINGVSETYHEIRDWPLTSGGFFSSNELRGQAKVCVLGKTVADNLFPDGDPVGQEIRIREVPFKIIGVLGPKGQSASGNDQDDVILVPYTTAQNRLSGWRFIGQILTRTDSPDNMAAAQEEIRSILRESHRIADGDDDDFTLQNQSDIAQAATQTTAVMSMLLASIASISLLVGGIGIMNIMLVSVTERTREIGIRMAIGARGGDVLIQFLLESIALSLVGGLLGAILGVGAASVVGQQTGWNTLVSPSTIGIAIGFSAMVGIFFGFYPARKAAALNPIEALRYE